MDQARSLICIPDISGFTHFIQQTEISHSKHIISELLQIIINSNELDLKVAEVEGDAVFFYRKDFIPKPGELSDQIKIMFLNFHAHLKNYEYYRICHCGACSIASNLSLKFIVHLGTFDFTRINKRNKPYGKDVILAHRLLKNNIDHSEYLLLTDNMSEVFPLDSPVLKNEFKEIFKGSTNYKELGKISYRYILLTPLHDEVRDLPTKVHPFKHKNPVRFSGLINAPKEKIYEIASNLEFRANINRDASEIIYELERVNRVGFVHECVISNRNYRIQTVSNDFGTNKLVYGELVERTFVARKMYTYTILEDHESGTRLQYEVHFEPIALITWILSPLIRLMLHYRLKKLFIQLREFSEGTE